MGCRDAFRLLLKILMPKASNILSNSCKKLKSPGSTNSNAISRVVLTGIVYCWVRVGVALAVALALLGALVALALLLRYVACVMPIKRVAGGG